MSGLSFVLRGLWFFRRSYLGVLAGAALGAIQVAFVGHAPVFHILRSGASRQRGFG